MKVWIRKPISKLIIFIVLTALSICIGVFLEGKYPEKSILMTLIQIGLKSIAPLFIFAILAFYFVRDMWNEIQQLSTYHGTVLEELKSTHAAEVVVQYMRVRFQDHLTENLSILNQSGFEIESGAITHFTRIAFGQCAGQYIGLDRHLPSAYRNKYPTYLNDQTSRKSFKKDIDIRFLCVDIKSINADHKEDPDEVKRFYDSHWQRGVHLFIVDPKKVEQAKNRAGINDWDFGIYGNDFLVLFKPQESDAQELKIRIQRIDDVTKPLLKELINELIEACYKMRYIEGNIRCIPLEPDMKNHIAEIITL